MAFLRNGHVPAKLAADMGGQGFPGGGLTMNQESSLRRAIEAEKPGHDFLVVRVPGETFDLLDVSTHRDIAPKHADGFFTLNQRPSPSAFRLVPDNEDGVLGMRKPFGKVVKNPPAGGHAAGGDDQGALLDAIDGNGFRPATRQLQTLGGKEIDAPEGELPCIQVEVPRVGGVGPQGILGHGRIKVDIQFRYLPGGFHLPDHIEEALRPAYREGRNDNDAPALHALMYCLGESATRILLFMKPVSIGRLEHEVVCVVRLGRWPKEGVLGTSEVT